MEISPLWIFWFLLAGAVGVTAGSHFRPRLVKGTALAALAITWLLWFGLGRPFPLAANSPLASPMVLDWQLDELGWQLSGVWLLLVTAAVGAGGWGLGDSDNISAARRPLLAPFLLAAAGLIPLLAGNLAAALTASAFLIGVWSAVLWLADGGIHDDVARLWPQAVWLMLSLLFIWLAGAFAPGMTGLEMSGWPTIATSSVLTAAWLQIGVWPFYGWRSANWQLTPGLAALVHTAPILSGLSLLARLVESSDVSMGYSLFLTLFGLLGLLMGVRRAWAARSWSQMASAVALVQANLMGLTLVWAGAEAAVGEARVLVAAVGLVFLMGRRLSQMKASAFRLIWGVIVAAGVAGMPLLAGFAGRSGLYGAWWENGRFVLVLVAGLLQMLLVTAVVLAAGGWRSGDGEDSPANGHLPLATLLLAAGLISWRGLAGVSIGVWLALLLPFAAGLALAYFVGEAEGLSQVIRRAFAVDLRLDGITRWGHNAAAWSAAAVQDAAKIWEGEGGLLWLFTLLIMLLVVGGW